jgi:nitrilase
MIRVAVAQAGSVMFDTAATLMRVEALCRAASAAGARLLALPEAMLGGYPKGLTFGATVGSRSAEGRELFRRYAEAAIAVPGPETEALAGLSKELALHLVLGAIERDGGTLYCVSLVFSPGGGLIAKHRKLMPTGSERLIWGMGDGSDLQAVDTELGRIGVAICWENYMPLYRQHLYNQGVQLWCAPTVDARAIWQASMRHIAYEGRCFLLSPCQSLTKADWPEGMREAGGEIDGRSVIVGPNGEVLAGPMEGEGLLYADLDLDEIPRGKFDLDVAGHYQRADVFQLSVGGGKLPSAAEPAIEGPLRKR